MPCTNWTVRALLPTPPDPKTTILYSFNMLASYNTIISFQKIISTKGATQHNTTRSTKPQNNKKTKKYMRFCSSSPLSFFFFFFFQQISQSSGGGDSQTNNSLLSSRKKSKLLYLWGQSEARRKELTRGVWHCANLLLVCVHWGIPLLQRRTPLALTLLRLIFLFTLRSQNHSRNKNEVSTLGSTNHQSDNCEISQSEIVRFELDHTKAVALIFDCSLDFESIGWILLVFNRSAKRPINI